MAKKWITTDEAVDLTGYNLEYLRRLARTGKVKAKLLGRVWQIDRDSLLSYLDSSQHSDDKRFGPKS